MTQKVAPPPTRHRALEILVSVRTGIVSVRTGIVSVRTGIISVRAGIVSVVKEFSLNISLNSISSM